MIYLAYGSNMLTERLKERVSSANKLRTIRLPGYRFEVCKRSDDGSGKCNIIRHPNSEVHGVLFRMNRNDLPALDEAEGAGHGYVRKALKVKIDGRKRSVAVYFAAPGYRDPALVPYDWYFDLVVAGARQHGLPKYYFSKLARINSMPDPKPDRKTAREARVVLAKHKLSLP